MGEVFAWDLAAAAHEAVEGGASGGKVILRFDHYLGFPDGEEE
jgi:hypothetical protein